MDYAVLVVSGTDGVQSHTETLWQLLERAGLPVFIFVNKLDLPGAERERASRSCGRASVPAAWTSLPADSGEDLALCSEELLDAVLSGRRPEDGQIARAVAKRELFPLLFRQCAPP